MKNILIIVLMISFTSCISSRGVSFKKISKDTFQNEKNIQQILNHSNWDKLLKKHVTKTGLVDYKGFKKDRDKLNKYISYLSNQKPEKSWSAQEHLAYFINVYNANTIKLVVDNYPVNSIKDISATISPFLKRFIIINNKEFSLADIEKGILQKMNEPRIHFAINCASFSCPKLMQDAYTVSNINDLMTEAAKEFVNSDENKIEENKAQLSEIFKWYKKDFLKHATSIINYVNKYSETKITEEASLSYLDYNWDLNDVE